MATQTRRGSGKQKQEEDETNNDSRVARMFGEEEKRVTERAERGYMPFRFFQGKKESCEITILDAKLDDGFARPEHNLQGADGKWGNIFPCISRDAKCPLCKGKEGAVVLYLSILSHRPYTSKKTQKEVPFSKMFLCLKRGQYNDFARIEKAAMKKYGTLRGVTLLLHRDGDDNSFSTGMPINGDDGNIIIDFYTEKELEKEFGNAEVKNKETQKVLKPKNDDIMPYDYRKLMPPVDIDEFIAEHGGAPAAGSRAAHSTYKDDEDEIPMKHEGDEERGTRRRSRAEPEPEPETRRRRRSEPEPEPEPEKPRRGRSRPAPEPEPATDKAARRRSRASDPKFND